MDIGTALVAIAGIGAYYSLYSRRIRSVADRGRGSDAGQRDGFGAIADPAQPGPYQRDLRSEVDDLRERIKVLERIATDGRQTGNLAAEIESLRDR